MELVLEDKVDNFYSQEVHDELLRVMDYPKFEFSEEEKDNFLQVILSKSILVEPSKDVEALEEDPSDKKFLECALEAGADFIVSGDPHLLEMREFEGIEILNPKAILKKMDRRHRSLPRFAFEVFVLREI